MNPRSIILGVLVVAVSSIGATLRRNVLWPRHRLRSRKDRPALVAVPPLNRGRRIDGSCPPPSPCRRSAKSSTHTAPRTSPASGPVRSAADARRRIHGPSPAARSMFRELTRGGGNAALRRVQARGTTSTAPTLSAAVGNIIGTVAGGVGQQVQNLVGKTFDQRADIRGTVTATARPSIGPNWRLAPTSPSISMSPTSSSRSRPRSSSASPGGQTFPRQCSARADNRTGNAPAQRSVHRKRRPQRMEQALPLDLPRRGRARHAQSLARGASDARHRGAAEDRRECAHAVRRRAGGDAHRAGGDQARLPVPRAARDRAAGQRGHGGNHPADRHTLYRGEPAHRCAAQGQDFSRGRQRQVRGHHQAGRNRCLGRPPADFSPGQRETGRLVQRRRRRDGARLGTAGCWIRSISSCASPTSSSTFNPRRRSGC